MEWPTSFPPSREDTHPDSISIDPVLCRRSSSAVPGPEPVSIPQNHPYWASVAGFPRSIEPHAWTVNLTGLSGGRNIPPQGAMALPALPPSARDEIPVESPDVLYASSSAQPRPDWIGANVANANTNSAWAAPRAGAMGHQQHRALERYVACLICYPWAIVSTWHINGRISFAQCSAPSPPTFECKWRGCRSATRFSSEGDLVRHLKSIHISPEAYPCRECGKSFGRKDHLRDHQRRRHHGLV